MLGSTVVVKDLERVTQALKGTGSSFLIFGCALFGVSLWRKLLAVEFDSHGRWRGWGTGGCVGGRLGGEAVCQCAWHGR